MPFFVNFPKTPPRSGFQNNVNHIFNHFVSNFIFNSFSTLSFHSVHCFSSMPKLPSQMTTQNGEKTHRVLYSSPRAILQHELTDQRAETHMAQRVSRTLLPAGQTWEELLAGAMGPADAWGRNRQLSPSGSPSLCHLTNNKTATTT